MRADNIYVMHGYKNKTTFNKLQHYVNDWSLFDNIYQSIDDQSMIVIDNNVTAQKLYWYPVNNTNHDQQYNYDNIINTINLIVGKRRIGKSVLMQHLYGYIHKDIEDFYVLTQLMDDYDMTDKNHILRDFGQLETLLNECKNNPRRKRVLLIDTMDIKTLCNKDYFKHLIINGRHYNLTIFIINEFLPKMIPMLSANIDRLFIMRSILFEKAKDRYLYYVESKWPVLLDMHKQLKNHECLVVDRCTKEITINKYKATYPLAVLPKKVVIPNVNIESSILAPIKREINIDDIKKLRSQLKQLKSLCSKLLDDTSDMT